MAIDLLLLVFQQIIRLVLMPIANELKFCLDFRKKEKNNTCIEIDTSCTHIRLIMTICLHVPIRMCVCVYVCMYTLLLRPSCITPSVYIYIQFRRYILQYKICETFCRMGFEGLCLICTTSIMTSGYVTPSTETVSMSQPL